MKDTDKTREQLITELLDARRRLAELSESEEKRYRLLADNAADVIWTVSIRSPNRLTYISPSMLRLSGYTVDEAMARTMEELFTPESLKIITKALAEELPAGNTKQKDLTRSLTLELELKHKSGSLVPIEVRYSFLPGPDGQPGEILAVARDITERKRMQEQLKESKVTSLLMFESVSDGIAVTDLNGIITQVNRRIVEMFGFSSSDEAVGKTPFEFIAAYDRKRLEMNILKTMGREKIELNEYTLLRKDGSEFPGEVGGSVLKDASGNPIGFSAVIRDITERKQAQEEMRQANEKLSALVNRLEAQNSLNSILSEMRNLLEACSSIKETAPIVSSSVKKIFPETQGALFLMSESRSDLESVAQWGDFPEDVEDNFFVPGDCWSLRRGRIHIVGNVEGSPICAHVRQIPTGGYMCLPLTARGNLIGLLHLRKANLTPERDTQSLSSMSDIAITLSEQLSLAISNLKLTEALSQQSIRDPLSGLFNRRYMEESLSREIVRAGRKQTQIGVVMADLDHLKVFNDIHGHAAGDMVIAQVGRVFRQKIRRSDIACRYGGEEFVIILVEASPEDTYKRADELREEVKRMELIFQGRLLSSITISMGVATYPQNGATVDDLLRAADTALYKAKQNGRDQVVAAS